MGKEIKNLEKAAKRILKAVEFKEKVILYGDADPDGVISVIILKETLEEFGLKPVQIYFPDREKEGYGINEKALKVLKKKAPALLISFDCAMSNVKEVDLAKKNGFEVIIIDHHNPLPKVPKASIIVNPKQKGDKYSFKQLACAGITYKLSKCLFELKEPSLVWLPERFLELVVLATLADQMILEDENEEFVRVGALALNYTQRAGLRALKKITDFNGDGIEEIKQKIIPPLNVAGLKDHLNEGFLLLIEKDLKKAKKMANDLTAKVKKKRAAIKRITEEVKDRLDIAKETIIFEGDSSWTLVFLGSVASRLCQKYKRPVFLYKKGKVESPGSVRIPKGSNGVKAMINCNQYLKTYGGHPLAAGFRIKNKNLEKFKKCLSQYFKNQ